MKHKKIYLCYKVLICNQHVEKWVEKLQNYEYTLNNVDPFNF